MTYYGSDYITLAQLKTHLRITDTNDDTELGYAITAASNAIDLYCNRGFGQESAPVAVVTTWDQMIHDMRPALAIADVQDTTGMTVKLDQDYDGAFEVTLTLGTDYDLWPWDATLRHEPYTAVVLRPQSSAYFPWTGRGVQVTAKYGWTSVPVIVQQACLIQAARYFVRRDSPYGIAGSPEAGSEVRLQKNLDPDVADMLGAVKRWWGGATNSYWPF